MGLKVKYLVIVEVESAAGSQTYRVEASSEEEAVAKFKDGVSEFVEEDLEVLSLNDNDIVVEPDCG